MADEIRRVTKREEQPLKAKDSYPNTNRDHERYIDSNLRYKLTP